MNLTLSLLVICLAGDESGLAVAPVLEPEAGVLVLPSGDRRLELSLRCPDVRLNREAGRLAGNCRTQIAPAPRRPTGGTAPTVPSRSPGCYAGT